MGGPEERPRLVRALGTLQATAINMAQMVGIGPFITIPLILATMHGPAAIWAWLAGMVLAILDGMIWAELGAALPGTGGPYIFFREAFSPFTGKLFPFLFVWTMVLAVPLTMSTGAIGMAQYLTFFFPRLTARDIQWLAVAITVLTVFLLYRRIREVGTISTVLWAGMLLTVGVVLLTAYTHFRPATFAPSARALALPVGALGAGMLISIYDYLGYYTTAYLGEEVRDPGKVIPRSIFYAIVGVAIIDIGMNVGIIGVLPWQEAARSADVGSLFMSRVLGRAGGTLITALILWTAFASVYTGLLGGSRIPVDAAHDQVFLRWFGAIHPHGRFPTVSLVVMGAIMAVASFFSLSALINALVALTILIQFFLNGVALIVLRRTRPDLSRPYRAPVWAVILALVGWVYVYASSGRGAILLSLVWLGLGVLVYLVWAAAQREWPFSSRGAQAG